METKNFGYSLKNIPIPTKSNYLKSMVEKVESFIRRLRWKAYFFCKDAKRYDNASVNSFGFKSLATPPQNEHLKAFEDDIYEIIRKIEFTDVWNDFQKKLQSDVQSIQSSNKSTNLYELTGEHYEKLLHDNITQTYKKANAEEKLKIDKE